MPQIQPSPQRKHYGTYVNVKFNMFTINFAVQKDFDTVLCKILSALHNLHNCRTTKCDLLSKNGSFLCIPRFPSQFSIVTKEWTA